MNTERRGRLDLSYSLSAARTARRWARQRLEHLLDDDHVEVALLVLSELVTNALTHGSDPVQVELAVDDELVLVRVTDHGGGRVSLRHPAHGDPGGRGLIIVEELAERWDVDYAGTSTSVWVQLLRT